MRLFYDVYSSRVRAEVLLLCADIVTLSCAVMYATGAWHAGADAGNLALLILWAAFPRSIAKLVPRFSAVTRSTRLFAGSVAFVLLTSTLALAGWDLLLDVAPPDARPHSSVLGVIFLAWVTGFFLCHARTYRLYDFLLLAVILLGLRTSRPLPYFWLSIFFGGLYLSLTIRHVLRDPVCDPRSARVNIQNARALSILATAFTLTPFLGAYFLFNGGFDFPSARERLARRALLTATLQEGSETAEGPRAGLPAGRIPALDANSARNAARASRTIGFSYRVRLGNLAKARLDMREVFRVSAPEESSWKPGPHTLWKAVCFSRFDPGLETWEEETLLRNAAWPAGGRLRRSPQAKIQAEAPSILLRHRIVTPVFENLVSPYWTTEFLCADFAMYRENSSGNVFPSPRMGPGSVYDARVVPLTPAVLPRSGGAGGIRSDPRYLQLPPRGELGIDLAALAARAFGRADAPAREMVLRLREYYRKQSFRYSTQAIWRTGQSRLREFLVKERVGDCTYFATSTALLLRAGGVPTRLAVGFLGEQWDAARKEAVIRNHRAHAWVEAYFPGQGWYPVDATAWVPPDPSYRPPPDIAGELARALRAAGAAAARPGEAGTGLPGPSPGAAGAATPLPPGVDLGNESLDAYRTQELDGPRAEDEPPAQDEALSGMWIEYAGEVDVGGKESAVHPGSPVNPGLAPYLDFPETPASPGGRKTAAAGHGGESGAGGIAPRAVRTALRIALIPLGLLVFFLLVKSFLKPPSEEDEEEEDSGEEAGSPSGEHLPEMDPHWDALDPRDRVLREYVKLQQFLERTRSHRLPHQTPLEHARRMSRGRPEELDAAFLELHRILYHVVYGGGEVEESHAEAAARCCRKIARVLG